MALQGCSVLRGLVHMTPACWWTSAAESITIAGLEQPLPG